MLPISTPLANSFPLRTNQHTSTPLPQPWCPLQAPHPTSNTTDSRSRNRLLLNTQTIPAPVSPADFFKPRALMALHTFREEVITEVLLQ